MCEIDILPGPAAIIVRTAANIIKSHSHPPSEMKNPFSHLMWNIAPSKITAIIDAATLVNTPTTKHIPPISSANAIGNCSSYNYCCRTRKNINFTYSKKNP